MCVVLTLLAINRQLAGHTGLDWHQDIFEHVSGCGFLKPATVHCILVMLGVAPLAKYVGSMHVLCWVGSPLAWLGYCD